MYDEGRTWADKFQRTVFAIHERMNGEAMYCPKCKSEIKPGSEIRTIHPHSLICTIVSLIFVLYYGFARQDLGYADFLVVFWSVAAFVALLVGLPFRKWACPGCHRTLVKENPFTNLKDE